LGLSPIGYNFTGFFGLLTDVPAFDVAKAGSSIPLKFSLLGFQGSNVFLAGYPRSQRIACDTGALIGGSIQTSNPGASQLSYDPQTDQYNYVGRLTAAGQERAGSLS
jgi:hypothetical protein